MSNTKENKLFYFVISEDATGISHDNKKLPLIFNPIIFIKASNLPKKINLVINLGLQLKLNNSGKKNDIYLKIIDPDNEEITLLPADGIIPKNIETEYYKGKVGLGLIGQFDKYGIYKFEIYFNEELLGSQELIVEKPGEENDEKE